MSPMRPHHWALFFLLGLVWGSGFLWNKLALREVGPLTLVTLRLLIGCGALAAFALLLRPRWPRQPRVWGVLLALGVTTFAMPHVLVAWGQQHVDAGMAAVLNATTPLITLVLAHFALADDRFSPGRGVGLLMGFAGVVVLLSHNIGTAEQRTLLGQLSQIGAATCIAGSAVAARRYLAGHSPVVQALVPMCAADLLLWGTTPWVEAPFTLPTQPLTWAAIAALGLFSSGLSYGLFYYLLHRIGPTRTHMVTYLFPLMAVLLGVLFLGEALHWRLVVGGLMILSGVALVNVQGRPLLRATKGAPAHRSP